MKLSPSRQFKSKMHNTGSGGDDDDNFTDIFRPIPHESAIPMTAPSMPVPSSTGSSPHVQHQHFTQPYDAQHYDQQPYDQHQQHQQYDLQTYESEQYNQRTSVTTVPDYSQYRSAGHEAGMPEPANGHNVGSHLSFGSQDFVQNDYFLRELRE
ncbi:hypothetical protein BGZ65_001653 [Modicella reniformis]|uniref:Uncharacterized protein n=1 Tax=Modicella reniformis TaxID=1440133 RepID=A0A9P6IPK5_9FUNG|nr:hypothetical protein BGZ65_001653 [Modicella reniformis]